MPCAGPLAVRDEVHAVFAGGGNAGGCGALQLAQAVLLIDALAGAWNQAHRRSSLSLEDTHSMTLTWFFMLDDFTATYKCGCFGGSKKEGRQN